MKIVLCLLLLSLSLQSSILAAEARVIHDLTQKHDAERVLENPHKGWYHHFPDNHIDKYKISEDSELLDFPGMDHVYIRLAWSYLEPKEGQYDWAVIDSIIDKWTAHGMGISFRISCKETGVDRVEQQFATPRWVMEAGAKGGYYRMGKEVGPEGPWEPDFNDPIFLAKLEQFLANFAKRYDGKPWLRYVDIGSIGDWGEGHCWAGSRKEIDYIVRKKHVDLHLKYFKRSPLVVSDDFVRILPTRKEVEDLHKYMLTHSISYRDDSILVNGYFERTSDTFTVSHPEFFADAYLDRATVFELEHYGSVKRLGNWDGKAGSSLEKFGKGKKGADYFRGALELLHATYIGYHGYAEEWLTDNPELTKELLNRCGYWLFPNSIEISNSAFAGEGIKMRLTMENRGVAPPYTPYELRLKLSGLGKEHVQTIAIGVKSWVPGKVSSDYEFTVPPDLEVGKYSVSLGLFDVGLDKLLPVEFALKQSDRDSQGFYQLAHINVTKR